MSTIIEDLKIKPKLESNLYLEKLNKCGFPTPAIGYPIITVNAIIEYLTSLIDPNKYKIYSSHGHEENVRIGYQHQLLHFMYGSLYSKVWKETDIKCYKGFPPERVLNSIEAAAPYFDSLKIITIENVKDPLVIGRRIEDNNRYLIDWWENDIDPFNINFL